MKTLANFSLLSGLLLLVIFTVLPSFGVDRYYFCLGGMGFILFSLLLHRLGGSHSPRSKRFRTLRKILGEDGKGESEE